MSSKQSFNNEETGGGESVLTMRSVTTNRSNSHTPVGDVAGLSQVEVAILRSTVPIDINETEEITVNGQRGIWANKSEVVNWRGPVPIENYEINSDASPEVITKRSHQQLVYQQEVAIRYLRPPTPPAPGDILIQQEVNTLTPPAPPLVIRQQPARPVTPQPLVIREAPPVPPPQVGRKVITISGKRLPPPPRKVVIERLPPIPTKPQSVIIERWLPYSQVKRRVIFQKANEHCDPVAVKPKNVIIQWDAPQVQVKKEFKDLGVIRANPAEYVARYGTTLKNARELPSFVLEIKPPSGVTLAADSDYNGLYELEGDLQALKLVDLDREGLSEYKAVLKKLGILGNENGPEVLRAVGGSSRPASVTRPESGRNSITPRPNQATPDQAASEQIVVTLSPQLIAEIFNQIDRDHNGRLSVEEAQRILVKLNSRLGKSSDELELRKFFDAVAVNQDGSITVSEFKKAFENQ